MALPAFLQLCVGFVQEALGGDHTPLMGAAADGACLVEGFDLEGNSLALHSGDLRHRPDLHANRGGAEVAQVQLHANSGLRFRQGVGNGLAGGTLHQGGHAGGGVDQQAAGAYLLGGILPLYKSRNLCSHTNLNFQVVHILSYGAIIPKILAFVNKKVAICL